MANTIKDVSAMAPKGTKKKTGLGSLTSKDSGAIYKGPHSNKSYASDNPYSGKKGGGGKKKKYKENPMKQGY